MHRFKLSEDCRKELLEMCHYLLPIENHLPKNLNKLKEKLGLEKISINEKKYCESCRILLLDSEYFLFEPKHMNLKIIN